MSNHRRMWLGCALVLTAVVGVLSLAEESRAAKSCNCPPTYAPVWCKKGNGAARYANLCLAQCDRATDCVPIEIFPPS